MRMPRTSSSMECPCSAARMRSLAFTESSSLRMVMLAMRSMIALIALIALPSFAGLEHLFGVPDGGFGEFGAAEHASDLFGAFFIFEKLDGCLGAALLFLLFDQEMLIGEGGDLGEVGDAEDLLGFGERLELLSNGFGGAASDADVDFVEDEGARNLRLPLAAG